MNFTKQDLELSESSTSKTESPIKQSPRLLQKIRGRKSLSRQVLEHNTFSKALSTPSTISPVSKETSFAKVEKSVITKKTGDTLEVTTKETKEEVTNVSTLSNTSVSSRHSTRNSISKEKISEEHAYIDTSTEDVFSVGSPDLPESLRMSNSLMEYIKWRTSKLGSERTPTGADTTQSEGPDSVENLEDQQSEPEKNNSVKKDNKFESEPMEVYEDLSNGAEDIKEVLMESNLPSDQCEVFIELSNCSENTFNELEKNIFETTETMHQTAKNETGWY